MMFVIVALMVAAVVAEPPPSNSYLPPPRGYPQGSGSLAGPEVVAARSFDQRRGPVHGNDFGRNNHHAHSHDGIDHQGYEGAFGRNAAEAGEPANYNFGYMVNDYNEGTDFGHHEERQDGRAQGEYHVVLPDGRKQTVNYEADERGFKPHISYQDTEDISRANGYDSNANARHNGYQNGGHGNHDNGRSGGY